MNASACTTIVSHLTNATLALFTLSTMFAFAIFFAVSHWMLLAQAQPLKEAQHVALLTLYDSIGSFNAHSPVRATLHRKKKKILQVATTKRALGLQVHSHARGAY
jgi:hypothetical protein